jgi:hypothetical protein
MIKRDLLFRDSDDPSIATEVDDMAVARGTNGESWDTIVEDEVDGAVLDTEVDDAEDAEVDIPMLDEI